MNSVNPNYSELIRTYNPHESSQSALFRIRIIPNFSESFGFNGFIRIQSSIWADWADSFGLFLNGPRIDSDWRLTSDWIRMKLFGADTNSGMIRKISDWFGMNFDPKLSCNNIFGLFHSFPGRNFAMAQIGARPGVPSREWNTLLDRGPTWWPNFHNAILRIFFQNSWRYKCTWKA